MEGAVNKLDSIEQQGFIESPNIEDVKTLAEINDVCIYTAHMLLLVCLFVLQQNVSCYRFVQVHLLLHK